MKARRWNSGVTLLTAVFVGAVLVISPVLAQREPPRRHKPSKDNVCVEGFEDRGQRASTEAGGNRVSAEVDLGPSEQEPVPGPTTPSDCDAVYESDVAPEDFKDRLKEFLDKLQEAQSAPETEQLLTLAEERGRKLGRVGDHKFEHVKEVVDDLSTNQAAVLYDALNSFEDWEEIPDQLQSSSTTLVRAEAKASVASSSRDCLKEATDATLAWLALQTAATIAEMAGYLAPDDFVAAGFTITSHPATIIIGVIAQVVTAAADAADFALKIISTECHDLFEKVTLDKLNGIRGVADGIQTTAASIKTSVEAVQTTVGEIKTTVGDIKKTAEETQQAVNQVNETVDAIKKLLEETKQLIVDEFADLETRLDRDFKTTFDKLDRLLAEMLAKFEETFAKLRTLQATADTILEKVLVALAELDEIKRREVEESLHSCTPLVSLYLPEAFGGRLGLARLIVTTAIENAGAAGDGVGNANVFVGQGDAHREAGRYKGAFNRYCAAYGQVVAAAD